MGTNDTRLFTAVFLLILMGIIGSMSDGAFTGMQTYDAPVSVPTASGTGSQLTTLDNAIQFLRAFGFFSVILPFLLIFAIVFGILEKTRIFGTEKYKGEEVPRRNLNSIVAFCIAFFVVAATNVVHVLQVSLPMVALVLVVLIVFLLLFGSLMNADDMKGGITLWKGKFKPTFVTIITLAVLVILLASFGILDDLLAYVGINVTGTFITSFLLLIIVVAAVWFVTGRKEEEKK